MQTFKQVILKKEIEPSFRLYDKELPINEHLEQIVNMFNKNYISCLERWKVDKDYRLNPTITNMPFMQGYLDEYEFIINNRVFKNRIYYTQIKNIINSIHDEKLLQKLQSIENENIATFKFMDEQQRLTLTGDLGQFASYAFTWVLNSTYDSLTRNKDKIVGFYYSVDKMELKRLEFYSKMVEQIITYKEKFVDEIDKNVIRVFYIF